MTKPLELAKQYLAAIENCRDTGSWLQLRINTDVNTLSQALIEQDKEFQEAITVIYALIKRFPDSELNAREFLEKRALKQFDDPIII